ncbi:MAG: hypothetical protein MUD05_06500 [Candidatus Nanopelagicales bacterium]|jgi:hypothetical protein|nr:hypothetical protein [Candidatus Nanopelagicales bacterium]
MIARIALSGISLALALACAAPPALAQNSGPARVKGNLKVSGGFKLPYEGGGGLDFNFTAELGKVKAIYYNSGDAKGFHMAKKKPTATLRMTYTQTTLGLGCETWQDTETVGFSGPVNAEISGLNTKLRGRKYRITDRRFEIGWSAEVNVHTLSRRVGDFFDCVTTITEDDTLQRVDIIAEGTLDRNNRTGQVTVAGWGPVYISGFGIGEGHPPDDKSPTATGRITFDRDVRLAD